MRDTRHQLRDDDIRWPLHKWLIDQHSDDVTTHVIHELKLPRPSARVDIALVNGELTAFEIKSDVDSLGRLPRQILSFNKVFDRVCVVTTKRHEAAVRSKVPRWWGIAIAESSKGQVTFKSIRRSRRNPEPELLALLHALFLPELRSVLHFVGAEKAKFSTKEELIRQILRTSSDSVRDACRDALKQRYPKS